MKKTSYVSKAWRICSKVYDELLTKIVPWAGCSYKSFALHPNILEMNMKNMHSGIVGIHSFLINNFKILWTCFYWCRENRPVSEVWQFSHFFHMMNLWLIYIDFRNSKTWDKNFSNRNLQCKLVVSTQESLYLALCSLEFPLPTRHSENYVRYCASGKFMKGQYYWTVSCISVTRRHME